MEKKEPKCPQESWSKPKLKLEECNQMFSKMTGTRLLFLASPLSPPAALAGTWSQEAEPAAKPRHTDVARTGVVNTRLTSALPPRKEMLKEQLDAMVHTFFSGLIGNSVEQHEQRA